MARSGGGGAHAHALMDVTDQIARGYSDVANKRPAAGHYSHHTATVNNLHVCAACVFCTKAECVVSFLFFLSLCVCLYLLLSLGMLQVMGWCSPGSDEDGRECLFIPRTCAFIPCMCVLLCPVVFDS